MRDVDAEFSIEAYVGAEMTAVTAISA